MRRQRRTGPGLVVGAADAARAAGAGAGCRRGAACQGARHHAPVQAAAGSTCRLRAHGSTAGAYVRAIDTVVGSGCMRECPPRCTGAVPCTLPHASLTCALHHRWRLWHSLTAAALGHEAPPQHPRRWPGRRPSGALRPAVRHERRYGGRVVRWALAMLGRLCSRTHTRCCLLPLLACPCRRSLVLRCRPWDSGAALARRVCRAVGLEARAVRHGCHSAGRRAAVQAQASSRHRRSCCLCWHVQLRACGGGPAGLRGRVVGVVERGGGGRGGGRGGPWCRVGTHPASRPQQPGVAAAAGPLKRQGSGPRGGGRPDWSHHRCATRGTRHAVVSRGGGTGARVSPVVCCARHSFVSFNAVCGRVQCEEACAQESQPPPSRTSQHPPSSRSSRRDA